MFPNFRYCGGRFVSGHGNSDYNAVGFSQSSSIHTDALVLGCVNARSVRNKAATICETDDDKLLDLLLITETWHEFGFSLLKENDTQRVPVCRRRAADPC